MKHKLIPVAVLVAALGGLAAVAQETAPPAGNSVDALVGEITAQQAALSVNQKKMDAALVEISEELRLARIFSARSGGRKQTP